MSLILQGPFEIEIARTKFLLDGRAGFAEQMPTEVDAGNRYYSIYSRSGER